MALVDHFDKMTNSQWHGLDSFQLFLGSDFLSFELYLVILDVLFLDVQVLELLVKLLESFVQVFLVGLLGWLDPGRFYQCLSFHHCYFKNYLNLHPPKVQYYSVTNPKPIYQKWAVGFEPNRKQNKQNSKPILVYYKQLINYITDMASILGQAGTAALTGNRFKTRTVSEIEANISAEVWKKQIRIKVFFEDYDKLRKGFCIEDKFISGLATAMEFLCIHLNEEEIKALTDKYRISPGDLVRYSDFVKNVDQQFGDHTMAKTNLSQLKQNNTVAQNQIDTLQKLLAYIKWAVSSKRILIKSLLQDFDKTKCSFITKDQFTRVLDSLNLVQNEQLSDLLCRKYARSTNPKEVEYLRFIEDVENVKAEEGIVVKGIVPNKVIVDPNARFIKDINNDSITEAFYLEKKIPPKLLPIESVIRKIQAEVTLRRIRIRQFFLDYDGLRKNIVTGEQFKRVLSNLGLFLTDTEFKQIVNIYGADPYNSREQRIKWMDFCDDIDTIFTKKGIDKDPLYKVPQIDKSIVEPIKSVPVQFTAEEQQKLDDLIYSYESAFKSKRVHLKPLFEDFDITKIGYVTKNQFTRILKQFDFIPKDDHSFNLLLKKYMDKGNLNEVNYYQFIKDVDKYNEDSKVISKTYADSFNGFEKRPRPNKATISSEVPQDLSDLLGRIRRKVKQERIRVADFMKDFDKLRHGNVSKDNFRLALNMAKLPLSEAEFKLIIQHFGCQNKAGFIQWKNFVSTIDEVFNHHELQKVPPNETKDLASTNFVYSRPEATEDDISVAKRIIERFTEHRLMNRLEPKPLFENWDKLNRLKVSPKQFRQVLTTLNFQLTAEQNEAVCKYYISEDGKEVRYLDFLNDTKPYDFSYMTKVKDIPRRGTGTRGFIPENVQQVLEEIRRTSKINRIRYKEYFKDFDPLNKGTCKKNKFKGVIYQTLKVPLVEQAFKIIEDYYGEPNDATVINYDKFIHDIDIVFNLPTESKDPVERPPIFDYTITHDKRNEENIDALMRRLGEVVRKHKLLIKPFFQDKDIAKIGRVSYTRMRSILDNNKIPLTDYQYELLCKNFSFEDREFNYVDFIESLKKYQEES